MSSVRIAGYGPARSHVWKNGPYPAILTDDIVGESARRVLADGKRMLRRIIEGRWLNANGVVGL